MTISAVAKIKNGFISLPKEFRKSWENAEVYFRISEDTAILKKIQKPLIKLSDLASKISFPKMNQKEIEKEIQNYRKNK